MRHWTRLWLALSCWRAGLASAGSGNLCPVCPVPVWAWAAGPASKYWAEWAEADPAQAVHSGQQSDLRSGDCDNNVSIVRILRNLEISILYKDITHCTALLGACTLHNSGLHSSLGLLLGSVCLYTGRYHHSTGWHRPIRTDDILFRPIRVVTNAFSLTLWQLVSPSLSVLGSEDWRRDLSDISGRPNHSGWFWTFVFRPQQTDNGPGWWLLMTWDNDREALSWSMLTVGEAPQAAHHNDPDDVWTVRSAQLIILGITKLPRPNS